MERPSHDTGHPAPLCRYADYRDGPKPRRVQAQCHRAFCAATRARDLNFAKRPAVTPGPLRTLRAPNPSPLTGSGTNTYLLGTGLVTVIDPGPALPGHLGAILAALSPGETIAAILVTHAHLDHSALARPLAQATGAGIHAFGTADAGRSAVMQSLLDAGMPDGGEGRDTTFAPDHLLPHGAMVRHGDVQVQALHTPGHMGGHLCFAWGDTLFSGDHVMGWSTSLVSPPDGDMTDYMASLTALQKHNWHRCLPGHGDAVAAPGPRIADLIAHRRQREAAVLAALQDGPATAPALTARIYHDTPTALLPAAARNVLAHLIDLTGKNRVRPDQATLNPTQTTFHLT